MASVLPPAAKNVSQYGLSELYSAPEPQVDIVLVHGLNGHPYNTWATHKPEVFWPTDLLPRALQDQSARILTYGYDASVGAFTDGTSKDKLQNHAEHLANRSVQSIVEDPEDHGRLTNDSIVTKGQRKTHCFCLSFPRWPLGQTVSDILQVPTTSAYRATSIRLCLYLRHFVPGYSPQWLRSRQVGHALTINLRRRATQKVLR